MGNLTYHGVGNDSPCQGVTIGAGNNVDGYQSTYTQIAKDAIAALNAALQPLLDINRASIVGSGAEPGTLNDLGLHYNAPNDQPIYSYVFDNDFNPALPVVASLSENHEVVDPGDAPENKYNIKTEFTPVDPFNGKAPGDPPLVEDVIIPDPPPPPTFDAPLLYPITIKPIQPVNIPDFTGVLPSTDFINLPVLDFNWDEEDYDSSILQAVQARISEFLAGGVGIPDYVWDQIWNRGRDKIIRDSQRVISDTAEEWSSRGFDIPAGAQSAKIQEIRTTGFEQISEQARELVIQQAQHEIENLKYAIAQGKALEEMIGGWYQQQLTRYLDAAKYSFQIQVELFNAQINLFNAEVELFNAQVLQYKTLVEAELSKLEEQKLYLEGQKLIGDLNMQEVAVYEANIKAYESEVNAFNAVIKGVLGKAENNKIKMENYGIEVKAYGELVNAKTSEYEGLKAEISAEQMKVGIFETEIKAYQSEVNAYGVKIDAAYKPMTMRQINNDNVFKTFDATIDRQDSIVKNKIAEIQSASNEFEAKLKSFNVDITNEQNRLSTEMESHKIAASLAQQETQTNIASASHYTQAAIADSELTNKTSEVLSRAYSQLSASAMGVVNVSAGISDTTRNSASCSTSHSSSV